MLLSTATANIAGKLGFPEALRAIKTAGFDAYDFSVGRFTKEPDAPLMGEHYLDVLRKMKADADAVGIVCNQAHASFPTELYGDEEYNQRTFQKIVREMEAAAYMGAPIIVVHAVKPLPKGVDPVAENLRFYRSLLPYCQKYQIKVAVENLFEMDEKRERRKPCGIGTAQKLAEFMDLLDSPWFTVCLDVGHAAINMEEPEDAIRILGKRVGSVHIHDNDYVHDKHLIPYLGKTNWDEVCKAFAEIGYQGDFTSEACAYESAFPAELMADALRLEAAVFRHLMDKIESYK